MFPFIELIISFFFSLLFIPTHTPSLSISSTIRSTSIHTLTPASSINPSSVHTIYISGPMTGLPHNNHPLFFDTQYLLESLGYTTINPANKAGDIETSAPHHTTPEFIPFYANVLFQDLVNMSSVDLIILLPDYHKSSGVRAELTSSPNTPAVLLSDFLSTYHPTVA